MRGPGVGCSPWLVEFIASHSAQHPRLPHPSEFECVDLHLEGHCALRGELAEVTFALKLFQAQLAARREILALHAWPIGNSAVVGAIGLEPQHRSMIICPHADQTITDFRVK